MSRAHLAVMGGQEQQHAVVALGVANTPTLCSPSAKAAACAGADWPSGSCMRCISATATCTHRHQSLTSVAPQQLLCGGAPGRGLASAVLCHVAVTGWSQRSVRAHKLRCRARLKPRQVLQEVQDHMSCYHNKAGATSAECTRCGNSQYLVADGTKLAAGLAHIRVCARSNPLQCPPPRWHSHRTAHRLGRTPSSSRPFCCTCPGSLRTRKSKLNTDGMQIGSAGQRGLQITLATQNTTGPSHR